jgi:hypothetical protein
MLLSVPAEGSRVRCGTLPAFLLARSAPSGWFIPTQNKYYYPAELYQVTLRLVIENCGSSCMEEYKVAKGIKGKNDIMLLKNIISLIILFPVTEPCILWAVLPLQKI